MRKITAGYNFEENITSTDSFFIFNLHNKGRGKVAKIYIEGDGFAWRSRRSISNDPTPKNPVSLKLALKDKSDLVIYLARPCQYVIEYGYGAFCKKPVWTSERFSSESLISLNQVIDKYKKHLRFKEVELVGFSGGGAMAMLLATQRDDIVKITTIAGNLDTDLWVKHHKISPLNGSLNPADYKEDYVYIPQVHYVGKQDTVIPPFIAREFSKDMYSAEIIEKDTDHGNWESYYDGEY